MSNTSHQGSSAGKWNSKGAIASMSRSEGMVCFMGVKWEGMELAVGDFMEMEFVAGEGIFTVIFMV